jgi:hypothetical protein
MLTILRTIKQNITFSFKLLECDVEKESEKSIFNSNIIKSRRETDSAST